MRYPRVCFLLAAAAVFITCGPRGEGTDTITTIMTRASVRTFTGAPVPKEKIDVILKAAMAAPSAMDKRPWDFIVITDRGMLKRLADALPHSKMTAGAGAAIIVAGDTRRQFGGPDSPIWIMDCSAASQNILLAAHTLGYGAVWTAMYPLDENVKAIRSILGVPDHVIPLNLIPVGVPAGGVKAKDKFDPSRIHNGKW